MFTHELSHCVNFLTVSSYLYLWLANVQYKLFSQSLRVPGNNPVGCKVAEGADRPKSEVNKNKRIAYGGGKGGC